MLQWRDGAPWVSELWPPAGQGICAPGSMAAEEVGRHKKRLHCKAGVHSFVLRWGVELLGSFKAKPERLSFTVHGNCWKELIFI